MSSDAMMPLTVLLLVPFMLVVVLLLHPDWGALIRAGRWVASMIERRASWPRDRDGGSR